MDARDFKLWDTTKSVLIRPRAAFSPFYYLFMLLPMPVLAWHWAGESLHRMELQALRVDPIAPPLAQLCQSGADAICASYVPLARLHLWSLIVALFLIHFMQLTASLPKWPRQWQPPVLRHAAWFGGAGLIVTLALVMARGAITAAAIWFIAPVWLGPETRAVQLALIIGVVAIMRVPPHVKIAWQLFSRFNRRRVGREVKPDEHPALWALINAAARRLGVASPSHLVLGVYPDCRLKVGKMLLDPGGQCIRGRILYLGITLTATLEEAQLRQTVEHALLRSRGPLGLWLPAVEDWLEASEIFLNECKDKRACGKLGNVADPALTCWEGWLLIVKKMLLPFQAEHAFSQTADMQADMEQQAAAVKAMLANAQAVYKKEVFHLFIVNLTCGVVCPSVLAWFSRAFAGHLPAREAANASLYAPAALNEELVLLEKEWLIQTGQASTPNDCWELRAV